MDDEADLLRAICANPDDDTPRLAYADWLEEHATDAAAYGRDAREMRDRARFIRVQIGLEQGTDPDRGGAPLDLNRLRALKAEESSLLATRGLEWDRPLQDLGAEGFEYRRGFPFHVGMTADHFLTDTSRVFKTAPIGSLGLYQVWSREEELAGCEDLRRLSRLDLSGNELDDEDIAVLARSPHLINLTHLDLSINEVMAEGARAIANSPYLHNLTHLDLAENVIQSEGAAALAGSPNLGNLSQLNLADNVIGDAGAQALANSPHLTNVTTLDLGINNIMAEGARALADSPHLRPEAKVSALNSAGFSHLAQQVQSPQTGHQPDGPG